MPIRPEMKARYPADWRAVSLRVRERAGWRCETCGVPAYAVGRRDAAGAFVPLCGNGPCDYAGAGHRPASGGRLTFAEAREFADAANCCRRGNVACDDAGNRWFVVVLTVAHVDHDPANCDPANLRSECQRCHVTRDAGLHAANAADTRRKRAAERQPDLFTGEG